MIPSSTAIESSNMSVQFSRAYPNKHCVYPDHNPSNTSITAFDSLGGWICHECLQMKYSRAPEACKLLRMQMRIWGQDCQNNDIYRLEWYPDDIDEYCRVLKEELRQSRAKEYWYFLTWTHNDNHSIEDVRKNINKFIERDLGFIACDIVYERGSKTGRDHIHMRLKLSKALKKQKLQHYERVGSIDLRTIRKHTDDNWSGNLEGYMTKENDLERLI